MKKGKFFLMAIIVTLILGLLGTNSYAKADKVKDLLKHSILDFNEIAKRANVSLATVQRVNKGESFNDKNCCYPLRTCNDYPKLD